MSRTAIVIGAGSAGLTALHAMTQAGFETKCLEKNGSYGGIWLTTRYPKLTIHSKSFNYRFFDFHSVASVGVSATRAEILSYFAEFIEAKGLGAKIQYDKRVVEVVYRKDRATQKCLVVVADGLTGALTEHAADVIIFSTGFSNAGEPNVPTLSGKENSAVQVVHSSEFTPEQYDDILRNDRKVVVLGAGKSSHEILSLFEGTPVERTLTWVYSKSLWAFSYERLYGPRPFMMIPYRFYLRLAKLRRERGDTLLVRMLQAPIRWSGLLVNPLEPRSDVFMTRSAIMKRDQLRYLRGLPRRKAKIARLTERAVVLDSGEQLEADYLICATGYNRRAQAPTVKVEAADGTTTMYSFAAQHSFYNQMIDLNLPEISLLASNVLYPQQLLGYSLGAWWLASFHAGTLAHQPTRASMEKALETEAATFDGWCASDNLSGGFPYFHQRNNEVLGLILVQMGIEPLLARELLLSASNEPNFNAACEAIARRLQAVGAPHIGAHVVETSSH